MILIVILLAFLGFLWFLNEWVQRKEYPPGPLVLPVIGNIFQVAWASDLPSVAFDKLSKKYGKIMTLKIGRPYTNLKIMQELIRGNELNDRSLEIDVVRERMMNQNLGIVFSSGDTWAEVRKFSQRYLREFGFGKTESMETLLGNEIEACMTHIQKKMKQNNNIVQVDKLFSMFLLNVMWSFATGVRFAHDDPKLNTLVNISDKFLQSANFAASFTTTFPILRKLFPELSGKNFQIQAIEDLHNFLRGVINDCKQRKGRSSPQNFVEMFINRIEEEEENPHSNFTEIQLMMVLMDLFQAGGETSVQVLGFSIMYLTLYPEVQKKMQLEIDRCVPEGSVPNLTNRQNMIYTQATICEIFRHAIVVPVPPARKIRNDFYYKNFLFKKGNELMYNIYSICMEKEFWGDPERFRPERFIMEDGILDNKMFDRMSVFGYGKRMCMGYVLATNTIFLFVTSLLQKMSFQQVPGNPIQTTKPRLGFTLSPHPFEVLVQMRK